MVWQVLYSMKESTKLGWIKSMALSCCKILVKSFESSELACKRLRTAKHETKTASEWFLSDGLRHNSTNRSIPFKRTKSLHTLVELHNLKKIEKKNIWLVGHFIKHNKPVPFLKSGLVVLTCSYIPWKSNGGFFLNSFCSW